MQILRNIPSTLERTLIHPNTHYFLLKESRNFASFAYSFLSASEDGIAFLPDNIPANITLTHRKRSISNVLCTLDRMLEK